MFSPRTLRVLPPVVAVGALVVLAQCGVEDTTGRRRIGFDVVARAARTEADTSLGWHVTFDRARAVIGPVRWYEGPPLFGARFLRRLQGFGVAYAHPGHYVPGEALADITARRVVDFMAQGGMYLGRADGVSGDARSAHLELRPPDATLGPSGAALAGATVMLRGVATRADTTVRFEAAMVVDTNLEGLPARATLDGSVGRWTLAADLPGWVDRVDFATLPVPATPGEMVTFPTTGQAANGLYRGVTTGSSWRFTWQPGLTGDASAQ